MLGALEWACSPHLVVQAFMSLGLVPTEADQRDPNRGASDATHSLEDLASARDRRTGAYSAVGFGNQM
jgi:hypothetical protein